MPTKVPPRFWCALPLLAFTSVLAPGAAGAGDDLDRLCQEAEARTPVQLVCPQRSVLPPVPPGKCKEPRPGSYVPGCPLIEYQALPVENGLARGSLAVAFAEYPELTNQHFQQYTAQIDHLAKTEADCFAVKGEWVAVQDKAVKDKKVAGKDDKHICKVRPRVRIAPEKLAEDTCQRCCSTYSDAIWKGQAEGPNAGCVVPSYVFHRGLLEAEKTGDIPFSSDLLTKPARLRNYGFSTAPELDAACLADPTGCGKIDFGFPGWAIVLRKGCAPGQLAQKDGKPFCDLGLPVDPEAALPNNGDRLQLAFYNLMPPDAIPDDQCNPENQPDPADHHPDCFHGDDVTNIHFHGSHVSPQEHQDYVLLELKPQGSKDHGAHGMVAFGRYNVALDPITWRQAEGTHWYHPHKHGSTALQVLNGLAGPLILKGPFDDFIDEKVLGAPPGKYRSSLAPQDKILVVQAIADEINLSNRFPRWNTPWAMVDGQFQPKIRLRPGEVQRWRIIGATQDASAHLELFLEGGGLEIRQIAQDGVQLAPENYLDQRVQNPENWNLAPGNRIDLLVRAVPEAAGHTMMMAHRPSPTLPRTVRRRHHIGDATAFFPLFFVEVCNPKVDQDCQPQQMKLPDELPSLPQFLRPVEDDEIVRQRTLTFSQQGEPAGAARDGVHGPKKVAKFFIDGKLYDPTCFDQTMKLGTAEEWTVINTTTMNHPLHIHTNPFAITRLRYAQPIAGEPNAYKIVDERPDTPIWRDTFPLPIAVELTCVKKDGSPAPGVGQGECLPKNGYVPPQLADGTPLSIGQVINGEIVLRHRFEDFSGAYVLHCHILGHEDRGMMENLQATCPDGMYGMPAGYQIDAAGNFVPDSKLEDLSKSVRQQECRPGNSTPAGPACVRRD